MSGAFRKIIWMLPILFLAAWISSLEGSGREPIRQRTSSRIAVDSLEDNKPILENFVRGLIVELEVRDSVIVRSAARVGLVEKMTSVHSGGSGLIKFTAFRQGEEIFSTFGSDEEINALEGHGIVEKESRTIVTNLPVPRPVDSLFVKFPRSQKEDYVEVEEAFFSFCKQYPGDVWCRPGQSLEP